MMLHPSCKKSWEFWPRLSEAGALGSLALLAAGCASTPLDKVLKTDAPDYTRMAPAQGAPDLGRRVIGKQVETNACFQGVLNPNPLASWTGRTLDYSNSVTGDIQADFGGTLKADASASSQRTIQLSLKGVQNVQLSQVFFDPAGPCAADDQLRAQYASPDGRIEQVVTRALMADSISITDTATGSAKLNLNVAAVGGVPATGNRSLASGMDSASTSAWEGAKLYFAHYPEKLKVTERSAPRCVRAVGGGEGCDFDPCSAMISGMGSDGTWSGTVSCQNGKTAAIQGKTGVWSGATTGDGVSYGVRVSSTGELGNVSIDMVRWNVVAAP